MRESRRNELSIWVNCTKENPSEKIAMKLMILIDELLHRMYKILGI